MLKNTFYILIALLFAGVRQAGAQVNIDESLAAQFFQSGEYDKSAAIYKKLLDKNPNSAFYYDSYLNSLLALKDYNTAEKELKSIIKKSAQPLKFQVDLGYIYSLKGDEKKVKSLYDDIINKLKSNEDIIQKTANAFARREQQEYVIKTYEQGRRILDDELSFTMELAALYKSAGNYQAMFGEYMRILDANPYEFETVKDYMQEVVMLDAPYDIFKKILLKKVQAQPDNIVYTEMLNWLFVQRKDFTSAFIQTKAMDKRLKEGGRRLIDLARIVVNYQEYELAERIYQSVLDQGENAVYYIPAQRGMLDMKYIRVTQTGQYTKEDIDALIQSYTKFLDNYGMVRQESGEVVLRLAEIKAQYANQARQAIDLLKNYTSIAGVEKTMNGRGKLALGDYSLLIGEGWEATLYYGQVEKMFKDNPLGHEAKFRNAKLSFYRGDFEWAKAQLDVLKSSTSELIANDAMQLALLIQDNLGLDTTEVPLRMYAEADFFIFKNMYAEATQKLDSINRIYPGHSLTDEILMARASIAFKQRDYTKALNYYEQVYTTYGTDIMGDDAMFKAAQIFDKFTSNPEKAKELYEKLLTTYQGSVYLVEARNRFRALRGDTVN
ncbi:MAG: tetratricopeptide repeat protein [Sphingobacteriales bacterium]|nr:MAG: tetratricopeptide repeat protein [Sphingobacteriales bacterium]